MHTLPVAALIGMQLYGCTKSTSTSPGTSATTPPAILVDEFDAGSSLVVAPRKQATACGGNGWLPASLNGTKFVDHLRALWPYVTGQADIAQLRQSARGRKARNAFRSSPIPTSRIEGIIELGVRWNDAMGDNALVLSTQADDVHNAVQLFAVLLRRRDSTWSTVQAVSASDPACDYDNATSFQPAVVDLTDLDHDGIHEVTFSLVQGCVSDVSPVRASLMLLEGQEQHRITGWTWVGQQAAGNGCTVEPLLTFDHR